MNSFATSASTRRYLKEQHQDFVWEELMQNQIPKIDVAADELKPVEWPPNRAHEWVPPGHGDLYTALDSSGLLDELLTDGVEYLFVSNSDNLGATLELPLLEQFARSDSSFMMEVCKRTAADKKGGHLAVNKSTGGLLLREVAQCSDAEVSEFEDFSKYQYFNTN